MRSYRIASLAATAILLADLGVLAGDDESGDGTRDRPYLAAIRKSPTHRTR